ncbi:hypothetical protein H5410_006102 [Solanum commersonii]|uniref:PB1-like domain-containing protein n=1 Tax=Solanum commersonii TaxID=4109 RepID=A0A9J6A991_SOLCO|nr:hypothetical protein H5410_006102 [Solanum commersonii]
MSGFTLVTLRWYHGGVLDLSSGQLVYSGGQVTEFLDVDVDRLSYFELRGYIKELGYTTTCTFSIKPPNSGNLEDIHNDMDILDLSCSLEDTDIVEVYVKHLIDDAVVDPTLILLENVPHGDMEESGSTFNKVNEQSGVGEDPFTTFDTRSASTPTPPTTTSSPRSPFTTTTYSTTTVAPKSPPTTTAAPRSPSNTTLVTAANPSIEDADDLVSGPVESDFLEKEGSDYSTEDSVESECGLVGDDDEDYGSDVHEEVPVGEAGADLGFDETQRGKISVEGRLGGDEPYFASSDDGSFEIDEDEFSDECVESERVHLPRTVKRRRRPNNQKIIHDPTAKKVVWQLGMVFADVNEFRRVVSKYVVQKRVQIEKCVNEPKRVRCRCKEDNNMFECFNSWILAARHKTMITMLDEIRVLQENIDRSVNCNIEFNGVDGFEVKGPFQHVWILVGGLVVVGYGGNLLEDLCQCPSTVTNMEMWHVSTNPTVAPPEISSAQRASTNEGEHSTKRSRGRPLRHLVHLGTQKVRGRPPATPSASPGPAKRSIGRPLAVPSASAALTKGARGRPPIAPATPNASATPAKSARGRPAAAASAPPTCPSPANYHVGSSTPADYQLTNSNKGR